MSDINENILNSLNKEIIDALKPNEREAVMEILSQLKNTGNSDLYNEIIQEDYDEIPVDIDTFIEDERFIGKITDHGKNIYPYWRNKLRQMFSPNHNYQEYILTGAIGLGKTTIAVTGMTYILYRLLCLKNPQLYYGLQSNSKIIFVFFNISLDLSFGVAYGKIQSMLMESPWFLEHGTVVGRLEKNKEFLPDKGIRFRVGSQEGHALGQDVFCLAGDTIISADNGDKRIDEANNSMVFVKSVDDKDNSIERSNLCQISQTGYTNELYEIEFENGVKIRSTGNQRFKLKDGSYKMVKELTTEDELFSI